MICKNYLFDLNSGLSMFHTFLINTRTKMQKSAVQTINRFITGAQPVFMSLHGYDLPAVVTRRRRVVTVVNVVQCVLARI